MHTTSANAELPLAGNYQSLMLEYEKIKIEEAKIINQKSVWLFLATVGCWSLDDGRIRLCGLFLTLIFFIYELLCSFNDEANARKRKVIADLDTAIGDDAAKKEAVVRLKKRFTGVLNSIKYCWLYWISFTAAWGFSFIYTLEKIK